MLPGIPQTMGHIPAAGCLEFFELTWNFEYAKQCGDDCDVLALLKTGLRALVRTRFGTELGSDSRGRVVRPLPLSLPGALPVVNRYFVCYEFSAGDHGSRISLGLGHWICREIVTAHDG